MHGPVPSNHPIRWLNFQIKKFVEPFEQLLGFAVQFSRERLNVEPELAAAASKAPGTNCGSEVEGMERVKGIEPSYSAWKAAALPLSYTRVGP